MMKHDPNRGNGAPGHKPWQTAALVAALAISSGASAQVVFHEDFAGGASATGFTIEQDAGACTWTYNNPGARTITGAGFDADFAIFDSDFCGSTADSAAASLVSPTFDASVGGNFVLTFDQSYRHIVPTVANVEVWDGTQWNVVYSPVGASVGYPDPAVTTSLNITAATGGSATAQIRFHYGGDWRWWWALDNINLEAVNCIYPADLAITAITETGAAISWTDNGSAGYEWAVTLGDTPNDTNMVASGDGTDMDITGLNSGTPYTAWVRADCGDGTFSPWSNGVSFITGISNDECSDAITLTVNPDMTCGSVTAGTVAGATDSGVTSTCGGTADDDVWFSFTAVGTTHSISLTDVAGSTTDMYMAVWGGDCGNLQLLPNGCSDPNSMMVFGLTPGVTYYLQVYSWTSDPGQTSTFNVCVGTPPPPPANDDCAGAFALTVNPNYNCDSITAGSVTSATPSNVTSSCFGTADDDVWFSFTATDTLHRISLENITGSTTDMYMALWSGDCDSLNLVPNSCSDPQTMNIGGLTVGTVYYLQVYTYTSTAGQTSTFDVCVGTEPFCQPPLAIALDSISAPDAYVSWTDNTASEYQYELRVSGAVGSGATGLVDAGSVAGSPLHLTGLVADSLYTLYVRSICSVGDTSAWSDGLNLLDGYCQSIDFVFDVEPICNVTFAGINNDSPSEVNGSPALENFTSLIASVEQGGSYTISATGNTNGPYTTYFTAFFDWDQNGSLETAVPLGSINDEVCTTVISAMVDVPADATLGQTRMRVVKSFNSSPTDPCASYNYGQAEDYTVEVSEATMVEDCEGVLGGPALPGTECTSANGFGGVWSNDCICVENVGIEEIVAKNGVAVFPNPASTELFITTANEMPVHVKVYDMVGHLVMEHNMTTRLDIAELAQGSYSLLIVDGKGNTQAHARFVKH
ncbi:MAG: GEVED domain-containing protein [Flavobacteriales bacterium]